MRNEWKTIEKHVIKYTIFSQVRLDHSYLVGCLAITTMEAVIIMWLGKIREVSFVCLYDQISVCWLWESIIYLNWEIW